MPVFESGFRESTGFRKLSSRSSQSRSSVLSLFCGCGGLDLGFMGGFGFLGKRYASTGFEIVEAIDNSDDAVETYKLNLDDHARLADLTSVSPSSLPATDILIGGFPCQDFSSSGPKVGLSGSRGRLYRVLVGVMEAHRPKVVVAENVPHLKRLAGGKHIETILDEFEACGYRFDVWDLFAPDFGLPQSRRRLFLVGVRDDLEGAPAPPRRTHAAAHVPIDVALADLESIADETVTNQSQFFVASRATSGGGQGDHTNRVGEVSYCIRANARGRIQFHYKLDRRLTVRECARLQSFPDKFVFPFSTQRNLTLVGNAVPPILGHHVARSVERFLNDSLPMGAPANRSRIRRARQARFEFASD